MKKQITTKQETEAQAARSSPQEVERIFETPEELLRFDAGQSPAPPTIGDRLAQSVRNEPARSPSWWSRLFGG